LHGVLQDPPRQSQEFEIAGRTKQDYASYVPQENLSTRNNTRMIVGRRTAAAITAILVFLWHICITHALVFITHPTTTKDWHQIAALVVNTFDAPSNEASAAEKVAWHVVGRRLAEESTYRQYVSTARKMKGTKYDILIAKEKGGQVIGLAELGINRDDVGDRRATIGVLCVNQEYRKQGVGYALLSKCQELVGELWKDDVLYAEVESSNEGAIAFFQSCGFQMRQGTNVMVRLRRGGRTLEERPHLLLSYNLTDRSRVYNETLV
jgi:ribosomal protein S18 acetylase RimI-like enzyme